MIVQLAPTHLDRGILLYVHVTEVHAPKLPETSLGQASPDARIIAILGARAEALASVAREGGGTGNENAAVTAA